MVALRPGPHDAVICTSSELEQFRATLQNEPGKIGTSRAAFLRWKVCPPNGFPKDPSNVADSSVQLWHLPWSQRARPGAEFLGVCDHEVYPPNSRGHFDDDDDEEEEDDDEDEEDDDDDDGDDDDDDEDEEDEHEDDEDDEDDTCFFQAILLSDKPK